METLRLKPRAPVEDVVENWDDDDFLIEGDDMTFRSSTNTAPLSAAGGGGGAGGSSSRRDSLSSFRSDFESVHAEEEQQVLLPGDDEKSTLDAIALAANAGIPLPKNVPPSALMGGTIKRLGGRKIKKIFQEDWGDDLELPDDAQGLHIKPQDGSQFPDVLRQVSGSSSTQTIPAKPSPSPVVVAPFPPAEASTATPRSFKTINLDQFRDNDDDDDFFGDGAATIKVPKTRQPPKPISLITPPTPQKSAGAGAGAAAAVDDDFEHDLELPSDGKLTLSKRKDIPKTPSSNALDDFEWGEGSLGTRFGGTRRDARSNRSSSVSALSPSVSSSITAESEGEDDTFEGLVLPAGPVNFGERLQRRRSSRSPKRASLAADEARRQSQSQPQQKQQLQQKQPQQQPPLSAATPSSALGIYPKPQRAPNADKEDFFAGLDLGDGEVFDTARLTLHRNVRLKDPRPASPSRPKAAVSITFTNKHAPSGSGSSSSGVSSRLPRPLISHERTHTASSLEPVSESGGPIVSSSHAARRSQSRIGGHSAQSSLSSIPTPSTPSSAHSAHSTASGPAPPPSTPRRRELGQKVSITSLRNEPTTTNAQLLRLKRSLPVMKNAPSPAPRPVTSRGAGYERPPSRTEYGARPPSAMRPKTPVDRMRPAVESAAAQARKNPVPFLPAGASQSQSHHITAKSSRVFRRHDSDTSVDLRPGSRAVSRSTMRSPSPHKKHGYGHGYGYGSAEKLTRDGSSWQQLSKPRRQRQFGDGHELDAFDDLPTSAHAESRFLRQPVGTSAKPPPQLRSKMYQNVVLPDRTNTPSPLSVYSPQRAYDNLPHFARDTAASRMAREAALAQRLPSGAANTGSGAASGGPLAPLTAQRVTQLSTRHNYNSGSNHYSAPHVPREAVRSKKTPRRPPQLKPHLIANLTGAKESKTVNGMLYNPVSMRWEGNENALSAFDPPAPSPSTASIPPYLLREKESATPRPALITPIGATKGVQVVGGMVFDPQNMCWLKLGPQNGSGGHKDDRAGDSSLDGFDGMDDSDEDVFKDIPDLDDGAGDAADTGSGGGGSGAGGGSGGARGGRVSDVKDDWLVGEEFDVGPEFIRRQREEEQRWRRKCERWMAFEDRSQSSWRWLLQEMVTQPV